MKRTGSILGQSRGAAEGGAGLSCSNEQSQRRPPQSLLKVQTYLAGCRLQRINSQLMSLPLMLTVRSDALFFCSSRDFSVRRLVPVCSITGAHYYPYDSALRLTVSGEHDILLVGNTAGDGHDDDTVETVDQFAAASSSRPEPASDRVSSSPFPAPLRRISHSLEMAAEAICVALKQYEEEFAWTPAEDNDADESKSPVGGVAHSSAAWYMSFTNHRFPIVTCDGSAPTPRNIANAIGERRAGSKGITVLAICRLDRISSTLDIARCCHLQKAMDYITMEERWELRKRGSKRVVAAPRITVEYWDAAVSPLPPSVVLLEPLPEEVRRCVLDEPIVMRGQVVVGKVLIGTDTTYVNPDWQVVQTSEDARSCLSYYLVATPRRMLLYSRQMPSAAEHKSADDIGEGRTPPAATLILNIPIPAIHSVSVYANQWPPNRMEIRFLGLGALPCALDYSLPLPHGGHGRSPQSYATTTKNTVVVAEFISRLAAREGATVRVVQFHPPAAESAARRLQNASPSALLSRAAPSESLQDRLNKSTSKLLERARSMSPLRLSAGSPQALAATIVGGSETLKNAASQLFQTLSSGVQDVVSTIATNSGFPRSPALRSTQSANSNDPVLRGGFDLSLAVKGKSAADDAPLQGAFFSLPLSSRVSAQHQAEELGRSGSFNNNASTLMSMRRSSVSPAGRPGGGRSQSVAPSFGNFNSSSNAAPVQPSTAPSVNIKRPLTQVTKINDYCRASVAVRQAFDDGGVRKVCLARYAVRVATDSEIAEGKSHAPRVLALTEQFNGADPRLIISDRSFLPRARIPYANIIQIDVFTDDVVEMTFRNGPPTASPSGASEHEDVQYAAFVFDEKKHNELGDHPSIRLADVVAVIKENMTFTGKVNSHDAFSVHRLLAKTYVTAFSKAAHATSSSARSRSVIRHEGDKGLMGDEGSENDESEAFVEVAVLKVPPQFSVPLSFRPPPSQLPFSIFCGSDAGQESSEKVEGHAPLRVDASKEEVLLFSRVQRLASNKTRWLDRVLVLTAPKESKFGMASGRVVVGGAEPTLYLTDEKYGVHRRIEVKSILSVHALRDVATLTQHTTAGESSASAISTSLLTSGCVLNIAVQGERRLIVRLPPLDDADLSQAIQGSHQLWQQSRHGAGGAHDAPLRMNPLQDKALPLPFLQAMQFVNALRHCCSFDIDEAYDESLHIKEETTGGEKAPKKHKGLKFDLDPNEVVFMNKGTSKSRLDYFVTPARAGGGSSPADPGTNRSFSELPCSPTSVPRSLHGEDSFAAASLQPALEAATDEPRSTLATDIIFEELSVRRKLHAEHVAERQALDNAFHAELVLAVQSTESSWCVIARKVISAEIAERASVESERTSYMLTAFEEHWVQLWITEVWHGWNFTCMAVEYTTNGCKDAESRYGEFAARKEELFTEYTRRALESPALGNKEPSLAIQTKPVALPSQLFEEESRVRAAIEDVESLRRHTTLVKRLRMVAVEEHEKSAAQLEKTLLREHVAFGRALMRDVTQATLQVERESILRLGLIAEERQCCFWLKREWYFVWVVLQQHVLASDINLMSHACLVEVLHPHLLTMPPPVHNLTLSIDDVAQSSTCSRLSSSSSELSGSGALVLQPKDFPPQISAAPQLSENHCDGDVLSHASMIQLLEAALSLFDAEVQNRAKLEAEHHNISVHLQWEHQSTAADIRRAEMYRKMDDMVNEEGDSRSAVVRQYLYEYSMIARSRDEAQLEIPRPKVVVWSVAGFHQLLALLHDEAAQRTRLELLEPQDRTELWSATGADRCGLLAQRESTRRQEIAKERTEEVRGIVYSVIAGLNRRCDQAGQSCSAETEALDEMVRGAFVQNFLEAADASRRYLETLLLNSERVARRALEEESDREYCGVLVCCGCEAEEGVVRTEIESSAANDRFGMESRCHRAVLQQQEEQTRQLVACDAVVQLAFAWQRQVLAPQIYEIKSHAYQHAVASALLCAHRDASLDVYRTLWGPAVMSALQLSAADALVGVYQTCFHACVCLCAAFTERTVEPGCRSVIADTEQRMRGLTYAAARRHFTYVSAVAHVSESHTLGAAEISVQYDVATYFLREHERLSRTELSERERITCCWQFALAGTFACYAETIHVQTSERWLALLHRIAIVGLFTVRCSESEEEERDAIARGETTDRIHISFVYSTEGLAVSAFLPADLLADESNSRCRMEHAFKLELPRIRMIEYTRQLEVERRRQLVNEAVSTIENEIVTDESNARKLLMMRLDQDVRRTVLSEALWASEHSARVCITEEEFSSRRFVEWESRRLLSCLLDSITLIWNEEEGRRHLEQDSALSLRRCDFPFRWVLDVLQRHKKLLDDEEAARREITARVGMSRHAALQQQALREMVTGQRRGAASAILAPRAAVQPTAAVSRPDVKPEPEAPRYIGASAGAVPHHPQEDSVRHTISASTSSPPPATSTKVRIKAQESFLQIFVSSEDFLRRFVKIGKSDAKAAAESGERDFSPRNFCLCQSERFRDVLVLRPAALRQCFEDGCGLNDSALRLEVRSSGFQWVQVPWQSMFHDWLNNGIEPVRQADSLLNK